MENTSLTFFSVDPGIENTAAVCVNITENFEINIISEYEFNLKSELDQNVSPKEILRKQKNTYCDYIAKNIEALDLESEIEEDTKDAIFVFEENDNKYTRHVAPILTGMLSKKDRQLFLVKPLNVWSSMKRLCGWKKGDKPNRAEKKLMTRKFIGRYLINAEEENSDDLNDALLNAVYMAKKMGLFKKKKKNK